MSWDSLTEFQLDMYLCHVYKYNDIQVIKWTFKIVSVPCGQWKFNFNQLCNELPHPNLYDKIRKAKVTSPLSV
jgi:hypothetical protein